MVSQPRRLHTRRTTGGYVYRVAVAAATTSAAIIDTRSTQTTQQRLSPRRRRSAFSERSARRAYNGRLIFRCRHRLPRRRRRGTTTATCGKHSQYTRCIIKILLPILFRYTMRCYSALVYNNMIYSVENEKSAAFVLVDNRPKYIGR